MGEILRSAEARASYDATLSAAPSVVLAQSTGTAYSSDPDACESKKSETEAVQDNVQTHQTETSSDPDVQGAEPSAHAVLLHTHGLNALKRGGILEAVDCLTKATEMDPMKPLYYFDLGRALSMNPKWGHRAEQAFLKVTEFEPWNILAIAGLAKCYTRAKLKKKAMDAWQLVLDNDSENEEALIALVNLNKKDSDGMLKRLMNYEIGSGPKKDND